VAAHPQGRTWPWGNRWRDGRINSKESGVQRVTAVGCFPDGAPPNGVQDILGNVWEWSDTPDEESLDDYSEIDAGPPYVIFGGCHANPGRELKQKPTSSASADSRDEIIGFRLIERH
jgi:formylglycine-generating enzyme required for sulfatase activity